MQVFAAPGDEFTLENFTPPSDRQFLGAGFPVRGTLVSDIGIKMVSLVVIDANGDVEYTASKSYRNQKRIDLFGQNSLDSLTRFKGLKEGQKKLILYVNPTGSKERKEIFSAPFNVVDPAKLGWMKLEARYIAYDRYIPYLEKYFSGDDYLFTYRFDRSAGKILRDIRLKPEFTAKYITSIKLPNGRTVKCNKNAKPKYEAAFNSVAKSIVEIKYKNGEVRAAPLSELYLKGDGNCYVPRFMSSMNYISMHSFGLSIDVSASLDINKQTAANFAPIDEAIKKLSVAKVSKVGGKKKYSFEFDGVPQGKLPVPRALNNFMLYEIAFAREGFFWGLYFSDADPMHFSLCEVQVVPEEHRKVGDFKYD